MIEVAKTIVQVMSPGQTYVGKQGFTYGAGVSRETVEVGEICMNVLLPELDELLSKM